MRDTPATAEPQDDCASGPTTTTTNKRRFCELPVVPACATPTRLDELEAGLGQARSLLHQNSTLWRGLVTEMDAMANELAVARERTASKEASRTQHAGCGLRRWSPREAHGSLEHGLERMARQNPGLAQASLEVSWPPRESFSLPPMPRGGLRDTEGHTHAPSGNTIAEIRCTNCNICFSTRLHLIGTQSTLTCLCAETPAAKLSFSGFRNPLVPRLELHNIATIVARHRPGVSVVTRLDAFQKSQRLVDLECQTCHVRFTRAVGSKMVAGEYRCGCPVKRPRVAPSQSGM